MEHAVGLFVRRFGVRLGGARRVERVLRHVFRPLRILAGRG